MSTTYGKLIYLMGASGAGKDSLLNAVRPWACDGVHNVATPQERPLLIARRHITRPPSPSAKDEQHIVCTEQEFLQNLAEGQYILHWQSHGLYYGIAQSIQQHLQEGAVVLVNGSREYLPTAQEIFPELIPVLVRVRPEVLRERLTARGRESQEAIEKRVQRASLQVEPCKNMLTIDNSEALESTLEEFKALISQFRSFPCSAHG